MRRPLIVLLIAVALAVLVFSVLGQRADARAGTHAQPRAGQHGHGAATPAPALAEEGRRGTLGPRAGAQVLAQPGWSLPIGASIPVVPSTTSEHPRSPLPDRQA